MKPGPIGTPAEVLVRLAKERGETLASLSRMLRQRHGYLATFVRVGSPKALRPEERELLGAFFRVPAWWFGGDVDQ